MIERQCIGGPLDGQCVSVAKQAKHYYHDVTPGPLAGEIGNPSLNPVQAKEVVYDLIAGNFVYHDNETINKYKSFIEDQLLSAMLVPSDMLNSTVRGTTATDHQVFNMDKFNEMVKPMREYMEAEAKREEEVTAWLKDHLGDDYNENMDLIIIPSDDRSEFNIGRYKIVFNTFIEKVVVTNQNFPGRIPMKPITPIST